MPSYICQIPRVVFLPARKTVNENIPPLPAADVKRKPCQLPRDFRSKAYLMIRVVHIIYAAFVHLVHRPSG